MTTCNVCRGRGHRVIATISDPHWVSDGNGRVTLARSFAVPLLVPCLCASARLGDDEGEARA